MSSLIKGKLIDIKIVFFLLKYSRLSTHIDQNVKEKNSRQKHQNLKLHKPYMKISEYSMTKMYFYLKNTFN